METKPAVSRLTTAVVVIAFLYYASSIFVPLTCSLLAIALLWPMQRSLQNRLPKLLALLISLTIAMVVMTVVGSMVIWGFSKLTQWAFANAGRLQAIYSDWTIWLEGHGIAVAGPLAEVINTSWLISTLQRIAGRINSITGFAVLLFIFVMLGLLEVDDFARRLREPAAQPYGAKILKANRIIAAKLRHFMVIRTLASVLTGLVVFGFALAAGLELAVAWGVIAFALNYIPIIGPLIATIFPTLLAVAQFESWQMALVVFVGLNLIQFVIGSYLEPILAGASLRISPFAVTFAVFFWTLLWGIAGAFIGVPILIALIAYWAIDPSSRWLATMVSDGDFVADAESGEIASQ